ncbi:MAG: DivIVA domain-containing protein [Solirubrobacteraceae bacterium]
MGTVELDRQVIERRDFPIVRRGYDPASVDAHLRALAADVEELRLQAQSRGGDSLAAVAGTQVQGILEAAQATAETIEREAAQAAQATRAAADADARRIRDEAIARAQERVAAVSQATEVLLARVATMDGEAQTLVESLRTGAGQLASDLAEVEGNMSVLYDSAAGRTGDGGNAQSVELGAEPEPEVHYIAADDTSVVAPPAQPHEAPLVVPPGESHEGMQGDPYAGLVQGGAVQLAQDEQRQETSPPVAGPIEPAVTSSEDLDGARLVALNMALNGDSREETGQYLAENFAVSDRERLLDEVYAAIEG